jgi:tripartite-type tricarboxylate transporter receptor subunit TctC
MEKWVKLIESHTKIVLGLVAFGVLLFLVNKYENLQHDAAVGQNAVAQQALKEQVAQNQQLTAQIADQTKQYQTLVVQLAAQNQTLMSEIAQRNQDTTNHQTQDQTIPLAGLASRWAELISVTPSSITTAPSGLFTSEQAARVTVQNLELVLPQQATIKDQQTIIGNKDNQINSLAGLNTNLTAQVSGLNKQIIDETKSCQTQLDVIKLKARKSKLRWFLGGVATGAALVAKIAAL